MFTTEELQAIDRKHFTVIVADVYDVTLISNNTKHVWDIHNVELKDKNLVWYITSIRSATPITVIPGAGHFGGRSGISSPMINFS